MRVQFIERTNGPERLICEAEIVFDPDSPLTGMKLVGFMVWRGHEDELYVTLPAQTFKGRVIDILRPVEHDAKPGARLKAWILEEYRASLIARAS